MWIRTWFPEQTDGKIDADTLEGIAAYNVPLTKKPGLSEVSASGKHKITGSYVFLCRFEVPTEESDEYERRLNRLLAEVVPGRDGVIDLTPRRADQA